MVCLIQIVNSSLLAAFTVGTSLHEMGQMRRKIGFGFRD
jgi:hypothetical protein